MCRHIYIYIYIYIYIHVYTCIESHIHIHACLYVRIRLNLNKLAFGKTPADTEAYTDWRVCIQTHKFRTIIAGMRVHRHTRSVLAAIAVRTGQFPQNAPRGNRTRRKGLRERNSPFCTLSQNGYGDSAAKPSGLRRAWAAERGRSQRQVCTPSGDSSGGCVCLGVPRVQRAFVEPAQPARSACQPSSAQLSQPSQLGLPAQRNASPAQPSRASPASSGCQPSSAHLSQPSQLSLPAQLSPAEPAQPS